MNGSIPSERQPVIIAARRTAIGRAFGMFDHVPAEKLAAPVINAVISDAGLDPNQIDDVILGNAAGGGGNIARLSALSAGLPVSVPGVTVDRQCGSGLEAIIAACHLVTAGAGEAYLAGGVESVSTAPWRAERPRRQGASPRFYNRARFSPDEIGDPDMGEAAENVARVYGISRERQDAFALKSHRRAVAAMDAGIFNAEIVAIQTESAGAPLIQDECPRRNTSLDALAELKPVFAADGSVTAGNSCPLNDGAAVVAVTSRRLANDIGATNALAFEAAASAGVNPNLLGIGPVPATKMLLSKRPELSLDDFSVIEFNEAFASQVLASLDELSIEAERINKQGGALALGHPFGASGAILVTRIFSQLLRGVETPPTGSRALAMIGIGGGMGLAAAFKSERI
jgi:acetyl-CoA C-acetyltransferase